VKSENIFDFEINGFCQIQLSLPESIKNLVQRENWNALDRALAIFFQQDLKIILSAFTQVNEIEHIISIREEPDEDGIWHDDGSRKLAFTLSLTTRPEDISGGILNFRKKNTTQTHQISTANFGVLTIFKTGLSGYEHQLTKVENGKRIISAGWIT